MATRSFISPIRPTTAQVKMQVASHMCSRRARLDSIINHRILTMAFLRLCRDSSKPKTPLLCTSADCTLMQVTINHQGSWVHTVCTFLHIYCGKLTDSLSAESRPEIRNNTAAIIGIHYILTASKHLYLHPPSRCLAWSGGHVNGQMTPRDYIIYYRQGSRTLILHAAPLLGATRVAHTTLEQHNMSA